MQSETTLASDGDHIPCDELLELCKGRCCKLQVERMASDGDGPLRWDDDARRWLLQRDDGYCVHNDRYTRRCDAYGDRPKVCRAFDCRADPRIWADYERRIPAPYYVVDSDAGRVELPSVCLPIEQLW